MAKRKRKDSSSHLSQSDSENPKKQLKNSSISINKHSSLESTFLGNESEMSSGLPDNMEDTSCYDTYESFFKAYSGISESGDESSVDGCKENAANEHEESVFSKKAERSHESYTSFIEEDTDDSEEKIRVIYIPSRLMEVVSLQHPASVALCGYVKVTAQLGHVSILGHRLKEGESVNVFSTESIGWKKVSTLKSCHKSTIEAFDKKLQWLLLNEDEKDVQEFLDNIGSRTIVLILEKALLPLPLQFLELYSPKAIRVKNRRRIIEQIVNVSDCSPQPLDLCSNETKNVININSDYKLIAKEVIKAILTSVSDNETHGPRILVYGPQGAGKSTLLRYLINTTLNKCDAVYYLDTDPGQTEFTPPGVVSLTKITEPLLGPPFSHLRTPYRMIFIGSVNVASPPMHQKSAETLMQLFNVKFPQETLFVNTMGWLDGIGGICFEEVKKSVNPTMLIELTPTENCSSFVKNVLPNGVSHIQIPARKKNKAPFLMSKELRNFALLAYFGQCQKYFMPLTYMNGFSPVCVCWDNIAIYVMGKKVPPHRLIEAIHCSFVALCYVHQSFMLDSEQPELPRTLFDEPLNECIGFGLVRAADEANHLLYIITPLSIQQLKKVNAIIKGNIMLPDDVFLKQPITNVPLPFTDQSEKVMRPSRQPVKELTIPKPNRFKLD